MTPSGNKIQPEATPDFGTKLQRQDEDGGKLHRTRSILVEKRKSMDTKISRKWSENISSGFAGTPAAEVPSEKPTSTENLEGVSKEMIVKALEKEECLERFIKETLRSYELAPMPWVKSRRVNDTLVRKITFHMKLPEDVPRMVKKLISLPEASSVTMLYRLRTDASCAILTYQTCTHDVTFGENFRVQETLVFTPLPSGGIELKRFAEVVWVAPLPWTMGAIKSYIEEKAKADGAKNIGTLVTIMKELGK